MLALHIRIFGCSAELTDVATKFGGVMCIRRLANALVVVGVLAVPSLAIAETAADTAAATTTSWWWGRPRPRSVPELSLAAAGGALVLAIGGLAVVASRRRRARNA